MATITYQDGTKINFNGTPTPKDIEEAYAQVKGKSAKKQPNIYDRIVSGARGVGNLLGGNQLGESIGTLGGYGYTKAKDLVTGSNNAQYYDLTAPTGKQIIGDSLKVGTSIIPTTKLGSAATGLASKIPVLSKVSRGLGATAEAGLVGYGQDVGQNLINKKENFTEAGLGTGIGLATPAALKAVGVLVGKPVGAIVNQFNPDAKTALFKALKPSVKLKEFGKTIDSVAPALVDYKNAGGVIDNIDDMLFATKEIKKGFWDKYTELSGKTNTMIDGNLVADKIVSSVSQRTRIQNPALAKKIEDVADSYRSFLTPSQAEDFLQEANAELDSFYAKDLSARANALKNPNTAYLVNEAEGLREGLYNAIESATGENVSHLKKMYGNLSQFQKAVEHRAVIEGRQAPFNLAEQLSVPSAVVDGATSVALQNPLPMILGMGKIGLVKILKEANTPDALIKKSLVKYSKMNEKQKTLLLNKVVDKIGGESDVVQRMLKYPTFEKAYNEASKLPNQQGGFIDVSGGTMSGMNNLIKEAKKYKSAEEFVKAQEKEILKDVDNFESNKLKKLELQEKIDEIDSSGNQSQEMSSLQNKANSDLSLMDEDGDYTDLFYEKYQELTKKYAKEELGIKDTVENIFDLQNLNQRYNTFLNFLNINGIKYTKNESGSNSLYIKLNETGEKVRFADHKNQSIVHEKTYDDLNITDNVKLNNIINKKSEQIWKEAKKK